MDWLADTSAPECVLSHVSRIFAVGDLHGNFGGFRSILRTCGLVDEDDHWTGGDSHLVQMGDVFGRGGEPGRILNWIKQLEGEAAAQGGRVHMLLGNHEILSLRGSVLHNTREEFADFNRPDALEAFGDSVLPWEEQFDPKLRRRLTELGCWEFRRALCPLSPLGAWLLDRPTVLILNDTLFVHGGLDPEFGLEIPREINRRVREEIFPRSDWTPVRSVLASDGPHWNRDLVLRHEPERRQRLERVLRHHGCQRMVVGHTPTSHLGLAQTGRITMLHDQQLACIDTGIGHSHGARLSALKVENGAAEPVYPG